MQGTVIYSIDIVQPAGQIRIMSTPQNHSSTAPSPRRRMVQAAIALVSASHPSGPTKGRATRATALGAEAVGIRAVAEAVGVTHAAPLHHFPDRVSLLAAMAAEGNRQLAQELAAPSPSAQLSARERLGAVVRAQALWAAHHPGLWDVMCNPHLTADVAAVWRGRQNGRTAVEVLSSADVTGLKPAESRALARRAEAFDELVDAKLLVLQAFADAVAACGAQEIDETRLVRGDRRPLVNALTTIADGLALQFVAERDTPDAALAAHVDSTLDLLLAGVLRR